MATTPPFAENLRLVLKLLSMSAAELASELAVDKSVVSRWLNGSVQPSAHNLSRLSALVAGRVGGFRALDWERTPESLAEVFGADPRAISSLRQPPPPSGLPFAIWDQMLATTGRRGRSYEGFFRTTRPHPRDPDGYLHEWVLMRRDDLGLLRLRLGSAGATVEGWVIALQELVYVVAADVNNGNMMFGIFNGAGAARVDVLDGLVMLPAHDKGRSPLASAMICERIADVSGDPAADDRRFDELALQNPIAPPGSVSPQMQAHLIRDFGPSQLANGGDWLLTMSLLRSLSRGPFDERSSPA